LSRKPRAAPDELENAAPLCPSCHETYGANPTKRKFLREARDLWYEILCDPLRGPWAMPRGGPRSHDWYGSGELGAHFATILRVAQERAQGVHDTLERRRLQALTLTFYERDESAARNVCRSTAPPPKAILEKLPGDRFSAFRHSICATASRSSQHPMLATSNARKVRGFHNMH
jgi:hypothetical protein